MTLEQIKMYFLVIYIAAVLLSGSLFLYWLVNTIDDKGWWNSGKHEEKIKK